MIRHLVVFNLKPEIDAADRAWLFRQINDLGRISTVKRLAVGKLLEPREGWYKPRLSTDYAWRSRWNSITRTLSMFTSRTPIT
jgi:hypothetical protein